MVDEATRRQVLAAAGAVILGAPLGVGLIAVGKPEDPGDKADGVPGRATRTRFLTETPTSEWPDASNTGVPVGTTLTPSTGNFTTSSNGQIVDALDITDGAIVVLHANVTVKRCRVSSDSFTTIFVGGGGATGTLTVEDCELECQNTAGSSSVHYDGTATAVPTLRRLNIYNMENGASIAVSGWDMRDCWIHDFDPAGADPHTDGIQGHEGVGNVNIIHNNIDMQDNGPTNSAIAFFVTDTSNTNWLVENNKLLLHPVNGAVTVRMPIGDATGNNLRVINNRLLSGVFDYATPTPPESHITEWSGNVDDTTGDPVEP